MNKETKTFEFPNGFRIIHENPKNNLNVTSAHCFCHVGSINENDKTRGAAHFIEHMCFKGTKKIPHPEKITKIYDEIGAYFNAFTEKEITCYTLKCQDIYFENCIGILSDMMFHSIFNKKEYEKELEVVIQETVKDNEDHEIFMYDVLESMIYQGSSYENPIDTVKYHRGKKTTHFQYDDILQMYKLFYQPNNFVLSLVSNISFQKIINILKNTYFVKHSKIMRTISKTCNNLDVHNMHPVHLHLDPQNETKYALLNKGGNKTTHVMIAFRTCSYFNKDMYKLELIKVIVGQLFNSMLYTTLRTKHGLTYSSSVQTQYMENTGYFSLKATTEHDKLMVNKGFHDKRGVFPLLIEIINDLVENGLTQKQLNLAKKFKRSKILMSMENIDTIALYNGIHLSLMSKEQPFVPFKKIHETYYEPITLKEINECIRFYFKKINMNVCLIGEHLPDEQTIHRECQKMNA